MWPVPDKSHQVQQIEESKESMIKDNAETSVATVEQKTEVGKQEMVLSKESKVTDITRNDPSVAEEAVQDTSSDEGWQEANSKVRSANGAGRKSHRRRPNLAKLKIGNSEYSYSRDGGYRRESISQGQKAMPKPNSTELSPPKQSKLIGPSAGEEMTKMPLRTSVPKVSPTVSKVSPTLTTMASKSLSYKEVAVAPPGTVLKPLFEKVEELKEEKTDTQPLNSPTETSNEDESNKVSAIEDRKDAPKEDEVYDTGSAQLEKPALELEEKSPSSERENPVEINGSKLSAAAQPFKPGTVPLTTSVYDVIASQGMLAEPVEFPPIAARVPCGPRSPLYYRMSHSFRMKQGILKYQIPATERSGFGSMRIMNPDAPEFVPRKAWQTNTATEDLKVANDLKSMVEKSKEFSAEEKLDENITNRTDDKLKRGNTDAEKAELARQILLSFIVKSVHQNSDSSSGSPVSEKKSKFTESPGEAIANDSAIIKILYGNEGEPESVPGTTGNSKHTQMVDSKKNKNGDGEGFVVVTKRRRNRQNFTSGVSGLYTQQSISASVR